MDFLNRVFRGDKVVWVVFMTLLLISIVEVFSAASMLTYGKDNYWWPIRQHSTNLMLGCVVVYIVHLIPYKFYKAVPLVLVPLSVASLIWVLAKGADAMRHSGCRFPNRKVRWFPRFGSSRTYCGGRAHRQTGCSRC